jgi:hypothetical protein
MFLHRAVVWRGAAARENIGGLIELPRDATLFYVLIALAERVPALVGLVIAAKKPRLTSGHACNINGRDFVRDANTKIANGDRVLIVSADATAGRYLRACVSLRPLGRTSHA